MRNRAVAVFVLLALAFAATGRAQKVALTQTTLKPGEVAPDFTLLGNDWKSVKLSDFRGKKNVILAFYVLAFTSG